MARCSHFELDETCGKRAPETEFSTEIFLAQAPLKSSIKENGLWEDSK